MKSDVALCEHLASLDLAKLTIDPRDVLDWYDGPVTAATRCPACGQSGLLEMLDWSRDRRVRIYAFAGLEPESLAVHQRNVARGSCDPTRSQQETAALLAAAGPVERLLALDVDGNLVLRTAPAPATLRSPHAPWQERIPADDDASWFARLGIDKSADRAASVRGSRERSGRA